MLVLSRKLMESIHIGDDIVVTLVWIGPNAVRLGIEAPSDINIVRQELAEGTHSIHPTNVDEIGLRSEGL